MPVEVFLWLALVLPFKALSMLWGLVRLQRVGASLEETKKTIGPALRLAKSCQDGYLK